MKKVTLGIGLTALLLAGAIAPTAVNAEKWIANRPDQIEIKAGQKEYVVKRGDTLWAIVEKLKQLNYNITIEDLANLFQLDLTKGEEKNLQTGSKVSFQNEKVVTAQPNGKKISQAPVKESQKIEQNKPVGEKPSEKAIEQAPAPTEKVEVQPVEPKEETEINKTPDVQEPEEQGTTETKPQEPQQPAIVSNKVLGVPFVSQGNTMVCEAASLLQALQYKGVTGTDLTSFVQSAMPISTNNNPYNGYAGEWRHNVDGTYQGMMSGPTVQMAGNVGGQAVDITGSGIESVKNEIRNGNPVVTWVTYQYAAPEFKSFSWGNAVWNGHVVTVDGFNDDNGTIHVVDPVFGASWVNANTFTNAFNTTGMAVAVR